MLFLVREVKNLILNKFHGHIRKAIEIVCSTGRCLKKAGDKTMKIAEMINKNNLSSGWPEVYAAALNGHWLEMLG